ncbi:CGNR zinc finger domain-containing protein [Luteipulveratus mongoliensis]|uniref:Zinc finger CGNR domain-containing protein n=1 Tax=Luteipulveratus mongoliensis TaxID=571913 RepID=A0A0K1JNM6_9MICO|nr:CGNR zinc finger domain-containing protein [Luteipulveratus mongoliensis]AKU18306.1 hypothetical protein VV02_24780 [Luteipulveratus mongoliensis]
MATWWITVGDRVLPKQIGGHPALELCNTRSGWGEPYDDRQNYLRDLTYLVTLGELNGLLSHDRANTLIRKASREPQAASDVLASTVSLRADLYDALTGRSTSAGFRRVADAIAEARSRQELVSDSDGPHWVFKGRPSLKESLDCFLVAASDLLTGQRFSQIEGCPGSDCGWLFLNGSGRRRWCQMAVCGNRAKQAAYADRSRQAQP